MKQKLTRKKLSILTVCVATLQEFADTLSDETKADPKLIEDEFRTYCTTAKPKQERLVGVTATNSIPNSQIISWLFSLQCYYLGGSDTSATGILGEMSKPLSWSMPALKVCEKLKKLDAQICDLRFGKWFSIDFILSIPLAVTFIVKSSLYRF